MVSGWNAAAMGGREVVGGGDPLAGIPFRMRFETHLGDKVLCPMWQDVARSIPVTGEGDLIATMGPADAELVPEQSDDTMQGMLLLAADSTPFVDLDSVNDNYPFGTVGGQVVYTVLLRSKVTYWSWYWGPAEQLGNPDQASSRWATFNPFSPGGTGFDGSPFPESVRKDGVNVTPAPFDCAPVDEWMVLTVVTHESDTAESRSLFQRESTAFANAEFIAFFIHDGIPSTEHRDAVETFYATLKPTI